MGRLRIDGLLSSVMDRWRFKLASLSKFYRFDDGTWFCGRWFGYVEKFRFKHGRGKFDVKGDECVL